MNLSLIVVWWKYRKIARIGRKVAAQFEKTAEATGKCTDSITSKWRP